MGKEKDIQTSEIVVLILSIPWRKPYYLEGRKLIKLTFLTITKPFSLPLSWAEESMLFSLRLSGDQQATLQAWQLRTETQQRLVKTSQASTRVIAIWLQNPPLSHCGRASARLWSKMETSRMFR